MKVEGAPTSPITGSPFHYDKASKGEAIVVYREPLVILPLLPDYTMLNQVMEELFLTCFQLVIFMASHLIDVCGIQVLYNHLILNFFDLCMA